MSNKISSINGSNLLNNKMAVMLEELNEELKNSGTSERETLLIKFNEILNRFYKTLNSPLLTYKENRQGAFPNFKELNQYFSDIGKDLNIIYREMNSLESFLVNNFNTLHTEASSLRSRLRRISSNLGDFRLQATDKLGGAFYFSDSFQNSEKIDYEDRLYNEPKCSIDISSGAITLPINPGKTKTHSVSEIAIGSGSNGQAGNNQELNALLRSELKTIIDSNPDTWFEYERVSRSTSSLPLILELKLILDRESIVNNLTISTTSFSANSYSRITKLEVSSDGVLFTDILDQVASSTFFEDTKDRVVLLDPSSGKFSGNTKIKIPPKKIKYINIVFQQDDSYIIQTPSGIKYRKAIGIRDIDILGEVYESKGELVSIQHESPDEIKKIALIANKLITPGLTNIKNFLSHDDGQTWTEVQSVEEISKDIKEILNFNLEDVDSIKTNAPVTKIRYKSLLEKISNGFSTRGGVEKARRPKTDFVNIGAGTQSITLAERPISDSINIKNVSFGSVGGSDFYLINSQDIFIRDGFTFVYLPLAPFYSKSIAEDQEVIKINNEIWERVLDISTAASSDKVYQFDYVNNIIKFGDDTTGKKPDASIFLNLKPEQVLITQDSPRIVRTSFSTDGVLSTTKLYRLASEETKEGIILAKGASILRTNLSNISSINIVADTVDALDNEKDFVNGSSELTAAGDYSIDYLNGVIYTRDITSENDDTIIDITYNPRVDISGVTNGKLGLEIPDSQYLASKNKETLIIASPTKVIRLDKKFIEAKSLRFLSLAGSFLTEVEYKGDGTEFVLPLTSGELDGYYSVDYKNGIIYTYSAITGTLILEYNSTDYYIEYNIAVDISRDDYTIEEEDNTITFTDKYIIKNFSDSLNKSITRTLFKVSYDFITELQQNPRELEPYSTPLLKDYALTILTKEQL